MEKRKQRKYKMAETPYRKAMARAKKAKDNVCSIVESVLTAYSQGHQVLTIDKKGIETPIQ